MHQFMSYNTDAQQHAQLTILTQLPYQSTADG
jgi:hypothetical protein